MATESTQQGGGGTAPPVTEGASMADAGKPRQSRTQRPRAQQQRARQSRPQQQQPMNFATSASRQSESQQKMIRGLGWFSVGLGVAAMFMPRSVSSLAGLSGRTALTRMIGARELASGIGILTQENPTPWLWARVAGDMMDLGVLGVASVFPGNHGKGRAFGALLAVSGITALDIKSATAASGPGTLRILKRYGLSGQSSPSYFEKTVIVNRSAQECYDYWRDANNLSRFMRPVESVTQLNERQSHWIVKGPGGITMEWDTEITDERPGEQISWRSLEGAEVESSGSVRFEPAPGGRGTMVRLKMQYTPPAGAAGAMFAKLMGSDPSSEVRESLRRFKSLLETGEVPTTDGQSSGRRSALGRATPDGQRSREGELA